MRMLNQWILQFIPRVGKLIAFTCVVLLHFFAQAQQQNIPLNNQFFNQYEASVADYSSHVVTSLKPLLESDFNPDTVAKFSFDRKKRGKWLGRKLKNESFIQLSKDDFSFSIDPVMLFAFGQENSTDTSQSLYVNGKGIVVQSNLGSKISVFTAFYETQAFYPTYYSNFAQQISADPLYPNYGIVPGQGRSKTYKENGYDFGVAMAYTSFSPNDYLNFQLGHGKNFIGDGYRSLLLSDNAINYPYLKINAKIGKQKKINYSNIFNTMLSSNRVNETIATEPQYIRKGGSFHYLTWTPLKQIQLSFFEGTIWNVWNDSLQENVVSLNRYIPIIGSGTLLNGTSDLNRTNIGFNIKVNPIKYFVTYGQVTIGETNSFGYQAGIKLYEGLGKVKGLILQLEYNKVNGSLYRNQNVLSQYAHFGQNIAHPYGGDFSEVIGIINYQFRDLFLRSKLVYAQTNTLEKYGNYDILASQSVTGMDEGLLFANFELGYIVNSKSKINVAAGVNIRNTENVLLSTTTLYPYLTLRTLLRNLYSDF